jgi:DNA polymerase III epsilon subunit-like protein
MQTDYVVLDIEASGLGENSFPIEIAWQGPTVKPQSFLIRPDPQWDLESWDDRAEQLHGIPLQQALAEGVPARSIVEQLCRDCAGRTILSDGLAFDQAWLNQLYAASQWQGNIRLTDLFLWLGQCHRETGTPSREAISVFVRGLDNHSQAHRALADVQRTLELLKAVSQK